MTQGPDQQTLLDVAVPDIAPVVPKTARRRSSAERGAPATPPKRARTRKPRPVAADLPVARVLVDTPLPHLDRLLDYLIPAADAAIASPGVRVRVRLAGRLHDGYLIERVAESDHAGRLSLLERVVSPVPVLPPAMYEVCRAVADHYAGTSTDVIRAAVPSRHAETEALPITLAVPAIAAPAVDVLVDYSAGPALLARLSHPTDGPAPNAALLLLPLRDVSTVVTLVQATVSSGRSAVVVVPDVRDVSRYVDAAVAAFGPELVAVLSSDLGPAERYREFLRVLQGQAKVVLGTRSAAFAPVADPGLFVIVDDGDDLHASPQAPYWHAREVLALRAHHTGAAFVAASNARSAEMQRLVRTGWARSVAPTREVTKSAVAAVRSSSDDANVARDPLARAARLPSLAWSTVREALADGPVLISVPRRGYVTRLSCQRCRTRATCTHCQGPLATTSSHAAPSCQRCGRLAATWRCPECDGTALRASVIGEERTAEEIGRAFPGTPVRVSAFGSVIDAVGPAPALIVATPGAEPVASDGYAAALLLDVHLALGRADLRANEEAFRRWSNVVALVRPASAGGRVVVVGESSEPTVQALIRHDPVGLADRELSDREAAGLPPALKAIELIAPTADLATIVDELRLPSTARVLGPQPLAADSHAESTPASRVLVTMPHGSAEPVLAALQAVQAARSLRKAVGRVTVRVDPVAIA